MKIATSHSSTARRWLACLLLLSLLPWGAPSATIPAAPAAAAPPKPAIQAQQSVTVFFPLIRRPANIKGLITATTLALPQPLANGDTSWCVWGLCSLSPRLYHEPLSDGRTLIGWTDTGGHGHISVVAATGTIQRTIDFAGESVRGLATSDASTFALLLWNPQTKSMRLARRNVDGGQIWSTKLDSSIALFDTLLGDSRLAYGGGLYAAYFSVRGISGGFTGHNGDQLSFVNDSGAIQPRGWNWGCSHSMAELVSYHPALGQFMPACSSDCFPSKGIVINNEQVVYAGDGNCGALVSTQLGGAAPGDTTWKMLFNALSRPCCEGHGIALATVEGSYRSSYVWLTNGDGSDERDPVIARLGATLASNRYLVGWTTIDDHTYWMGVIDGAGAFQIGPEEVSSAGVAWGNRDDSLRTRADGGISWVQGTGQSTTLRLFRFDLAPFLKYSALR
jgi:hypothetical protein